MNEPILTQLVALAGAHREMTATIVLAVGGLVAGLLDALC